MTKSTNNKILTRDQIMEKYYGSSNKDRFTQTMKEFIKFLDEFEDNVKNFYSKFENSTWDLRKSVIDFCHYLSFNYNQEDRLKQSQKDRSVQKEILTNWIKILEPLLNDEYLLIIELGLDENINRLKNKLNEYKEQLQFIQDKTRAGYNKPIESYQKDILGELKKMNIGQTKRLQFIYDILVEFHPDEFQGQDSVSVKEN